MKHDFYEDYNEIMFDERDTIKRFLDKLNSITGQSVWRFAPAIDMMANNGTHVKLNAIKLDDDRFVVFYVDEPIQKNVKWECIHFAYGALSKVIDALPELDELIPDIMDTHNSHNAELVRKINAAWKSEKYHLMFGDILYAIGCRDNQEIYEKYDVIIDCNEAAMDCAHEIMEGVCDDLDLKTILSFIRYEED
jgi:hypothetical protein